MDAVRFRFLFQSRKEPMKMSYQRVLRIVVALTVGIACVAVYPDAAAAKKKRSKRNSASKRAAQRRAIQGAIQRTKVQVEAAKQVRAVAAQRARTAQAKVQSAEGRVSTALTGIENAKSEAVSTTERLRAVEAEIEAARGPDSEFTRARVALEEAERKFQAERDRVLSSPDYKARYKAALDSGNKGMLLQIRNGALEDDAEFQATSRRHEWAETTFNRMRRELYAKHPNWVAGGKAARQARADLARSKQAVSAGMLTRAGARSNFRQAAGTAAAANAVVERGEAAIKRLQSAQKRLSTPKKSSYRRR